jgi:hypothetical protein
MGGKFDINSEENIGTNIILTFPKPKSSGKYTKIKFSDKLN